MDKAKAVLLSLSLDEIKNIKKIADVWYDRFHRMLKQTTNVISQVSISQSFHLIKLLCSSELGFL